VPVRYRIEAEAAALSSLAVLSRWTKGASARPAHRTRPSLAGRFRAGARREWGVLPTQFSKSGRHALHFGCLSSWRSWRAVRSSSPRPTRRCSGGRFGRPAVPDDRARVGTIAAPSAPSPRSSLRTCARSRRRAPPASRSSRLCSPREKVRHLRHFWKVRQDSLPLSLLKELRALLSSDSPALVDRRLRRSARHARSTELRALRESGTERSPRGPALPPRAA